MHIFQQNISIFDFLTCALRAQVSISQKLKLYWKSKVTFILKQFFLYKVTLILKWREYFLNLLLILLQD